MHVYATSRLHLSDAEAFLRIAVARVSRRFPMVLSMLAEGRIHLSAVAMLAKHLDDANGEALLRRAAHRSKREVEMLIAEIAPQPDAPSGMRRLPKPRSAGVPTGGGAPLLPTGVGSKAVPAENGGSLVPDGVGLRGVAHDVEPPVHSGPAPRPGPPAPAVMVPTAPDRYRVQFTADEELRGKIDRARAMLRHQIPDGNLAAVFDRAMSLLIRELERTRFAGTSAPRTSASEVDSTPSSRHIPAAIKREVWKRDGEQCTFHDRKGRRCLARDRLEFHHIIPFARGGDHEAANVTLRCSTQRLPGRPRLRLGLHGDPQTEPALLGAMSARELRPRTRRRRRRQPAHACAMSARRRARLARSGFARGGLGSSPGRHCSSACSRTNRGSPPNRHISSRSLRWVSSGSLVIAVPCSFLNLSEVRQ